MLDELATTSTARRAIDAARRRALTIPAAVTKAEAVAEQVQTVARQADPTRPPLPTRPDQVADTLTGHARKLAEVRALRDLATGYDQEAAQAIIAATRNAAPAWIKALTTLFDEHIKGLREALKAVPDQIDTGALDRLSVDEFAAYQQATTAMHELDTLADDRCIIGRAGGEPASRDRLFAACCQLPAPTTERVAAKDWTSYAHLRNQWRDKTPPLTRWRGTLDDSRLTLTLAPYGGLTTRLQRLDLWSNATATLGHAFNAKTDLQRLLGEEADRTYRTVAGVPTP